MGVKTSWLVINKHYDGLRRDRDPVEERLAFAVLVELVIWSAHQENGKDGSNQSSAQFPFA